MVIDGIQLYNKALAQARSQRDYNFRPIRKTDNAYVAKIIHDVMSEFGAVGEGYSILDSEVQAMYESYQGEKSAYFVAECRGRIIGGAGIGPLKGGRRATCELKKMYLLPESRGAGIGRMLLERCLEAAKSMGYKKCYLETLQHMVQAKRLYEKYGFTPLKAPQGNTGHFKCNNWYQKAL